jgi:hypothetical protein
VHGGVPHRRPASDADGDAAAGAVARRSRFDALGAVR